MRVARSVPLILGALAVVGIAVAIVLAVAGRSSDGRERPPPKFFSVAPAIEGQYIVVLPPETPAHGVRGTAAALTDEYGGRVTRRYAAAGAELRGFAVTGLSEERARRLASDRRVKSVEEVARAFPAWKRTNPGWALDQLDQRSLSASGLFRYSADGEGVRVYVLDTGIVATHPQFASSGNVQFGFDAYGGTGADCSGHGTAMAGHIAGSTLGVAPAAEVVNVKVLNCNPIGSNTAAIVAGVTWVTANARPPAVANLSLQLQHGSSAPALRTAIADLLRRDVLVVVAAGNDNDDVAQVEPANYPGVLTVGGTLVSGSRWSPGSPPTGCVTPPSDCGSNFGTAIELFAGAVATTAHWQGGETTPPAGTSTAAAIVSGVAAATLQAFWRPLEPGKAYIRLPSESVHRAIVANATENLLTDVRTSPNRLVYAEAWPISVGAVKVSGPGGFTSTAGSPVSSGLDRSFLVSGGLAHRFDASPTLNDSPYAAQAFDREVPRWASPHHVNDGGCADVYDVNIAHAWLACTRQTALGVRGSIKAVEVDDGSLVGEVNVGLGAAVPAGQTCSQPRSIARAVRVDSTGAVYAVGEAWCGSGPRTAFLAKVDTHANTVIWERRIFDQGTSSSAAYSLVLDSGRVVVAGAQTLSTGSSAVARVAQFSANGVPLGSGIDLATPGPSAAYAISADEATGALYVGATRPAGDTAIVVRLHPNLTTDWVRELAGARIYGIAALKNDGVVVGGRTGRFLPFTPVTEPITGQLVGRPLGANRGFMIRYGTAGALRWTRYVEAGIVGLSLEGAREFGPNIVAVVAGEAANPPCPPQQICVITTATFAEAFRVK